MRRLLCTLTALSLLALTLPVAPARAQSGPGTTGTGSIAGQVLDRDTRQPIAQASLTLEGLQLGATSGDDGRFVLQGVPAGSHRVRGWRLDYPAHVVSDVVVTPGRTTQVLVELAAEAVKQSEVEVRASGFARAADQRTSSYPMSQEEIRRSPGALGDVFRLVQSLPGVINTNDQRNDVVARGGSPSENLVLIDGIEVPYVNHFAAQGSSGGPVSMLNNELVRDADFLAGGMPVRFGGRLSSVMDIRLREGDRERFRSATDLTAAGYGTLLEGPLGSRGSWLLSARNSYYDLVAEPFGITSVPFTSNGQLKLTWEAGPHDQLWFDNLTGRDHIDFAYRPDDLEDPYSVEVSTGGWRTVNGLAWQHHLDTRGYLTLVASDAYSRFGTDTHDPLRGGALVFHDATGEGETQLKADVHLRTALGTFKTGAQLKRLRGAYEIAQPQGVENPFSTDTTRIDAFALDLATTALDAAAHAQWTRALGARTEATLGVRGHRFGAIERTALDPRASVTLKATGTLDLALSWSRHHQSPALAFVAAFPENRELAPMRADHLVAGLAWTPSPDVKLTLETYLKRYSGYPVARDIPELSLANSGDQYGLQGLLFPMLSVGTGRSRGIEFFVQKKLTQGLYGQLSYSVSRSEHRALDGVLRRGGFDVPQAGTFIVGYKKGARWEFSTRGSFASGRPYTPPLEPYSTDQRRYVYDLANLNGARAPAYARLDLRADRRFSLGSRNVTVWLEAGNVLDRANVFQYLWNNKTNSLGTVRQIRFLPVLGVKVEL